MTKEEKENLNIYRAVAAYFLSKNGGHVMVPKDFILLNGEITVAHRLTPEGLEMKLINEPTTMQ